MSYCDNNFSDAKFYCFNMYLLALFYLQTARLPQKWLPMAFEHCSLFMRAQRVVGHGRRAPLLCQDLQQRNQFHHRHPHCGGGLDLLCGVLQTQ